ncbi:MAG: tripartite tricarboxylate transporter substrate binding protein [Burkholderiales bacterium]
MRHPISRRRLVIGMTALAAAGLAPSAFGQSAFPSRPIRFLVGVPPGGSSDVAARILAEEMSKTLGQPVVVENKTGASANIAAQALVAAPADGYTLLFLQFSHLTNPSLMANVGYDPAKDLAMVSQITTLPVVALARADSPLNDLQDVVKAAKAKKGELKVGSGGNGTSSHIAAELLARAAGYEYIHVPYRGGAPAFQALLAGDVDLTFDFVTPAMKGSADAGKIKFLGAMQQEKVATLPTIVPAGAQGIPASAFIHPWQAVAVRAGTPAPVVDRLHASVTAALRNKDVIAKLEAIGTEVHPSAKPADMQALYDADLKHWTTFIKAAGIKAD